MLDAAPMRTPRPAPGRWLPAVLAVAGLALAVAAGVGGAVALIAGIAAQPVLVLAVRHWRTREPITAVLLRRDVSGLLALWAAAAVGVAAVLAWPLSALLRSGSLLATLALSTVGGFLLLGLWRLWPLWQRLERDGGSLPQHWRSLAMLQVGVWRGLGVAVAVAGLASALALLAWPGLVDDAAARWGLTTAFALASLGVHAWLQWIAPADELLDDGLLVESEASDGDTLEDEVMASDFSVQGTPAGESLPIGAAVPPAEPLEPALYAAARAGRVERALELIEAGADPHALPPDTDRDRRSLPALGAVLPDLRLLRGLIARGVDLNVAHAGVTPLLAATRDSWHGRPDSVMTLLANGADPRAADGEGNTPLHHAARSSDPGVAALLRDAAAEIDALNNDGLTPLAVACSAGNWRLARFLLERGAKPEPAGGQPALLHAAAGEEDDPAGVHLLLKLKARIDARSLDDTSALHAAALAGHQEIVAALLDAGADATALDAHQRTPLHDAARGGHPAVLEKLLGRLPRGGVAEVAMTDEDGCNVLMLACAAQGATPEMVAQLLALGLDAEHRGSDGKRAVDHAAEAGRWSLVAALDAGYALPANVSGDAGTPSDRAPAALLREGLTEGREHGLDALAELLSATELGALLHDGDAVPPPPQIDWLLARGADPEVRDGAGLTPMAAWLARGPAARASMQALLDRGVSPSGCGGLAGFMAACADTDQRVAPGASTPAQSTASAPTSVQPVSNQSSSNQSSSDRSASDQSSPDQPSAIPSAPERFALQLLDRGADPFAGSRAGDPPLTLAVRLDWLRMVSRLLAIGVALDPRDSHGMSALHLAVALGREAMLKQLIAHGATHDLRAADGQTPLGVALSSGRRDLADWLDWRGWPLPKRPLLEADVPAAAIVGDADAVRRLLDLGLAVDAVDSQGCTALLRAAGGGHRAVVDLLLARGADPRLAADSGATPLSAATSMRQIDIVDRLLAAGAPIEQRLPGELTVLMVASALGLPELVARLLVAGADVHAVDAQQRCALHCAAMFGFGATERTRLLALLDTLLLAGAESDIDVAAAGATPPLLLLGARAEPGSPASEDVLIAALEVLMSHDARLDAQDPRGFGPLHLAALHGLIDVARWLLRAGADPDLRDALNRTPREIAVMRGFVDIAAELELAPVVPGGDVSMARYLRDPR